MLDRALELRADDPVDPYAQAKTEIVYARWLLAKGEQSAAYDCLSKALATLERRNLDDKKINFGHNPLEIGIQQEMERSQTAAMAQQFAEVYYQDGLLLSADILLQRQDYLKARAIANRVLQSVNANTEMFLQARAFGELLKIETTASNFDEADKWADLALAAVNDHRACGMAAVDILNAAADLKRAEGKMEAAQKCYQEAADRLAKIGVPADARLTKLRRFL